MTQKELVYRLGDKDYQLKFSMRVPLFFEQATRKNYFEVFGTGKTPSLTDILTLVWSCFKNGGGKMTLDELADQLDNERLKDLSGQVMQLIAHGTSQSKVDDATAPPSGALPQNSPTCGQ